PKISASLTPTEDSSPVARSATPPADVLPEMPPLPGGSPGDTTQTPDAGVKTSDAVAAGAIAAGAIAAATADENDAPAFTVDAPPLAADPGAAATPEASAAAAPGAVP